MILKEENTTESCNDRDHSRGSEDDSLMPSCDNGNPSEILNNGKNGACFSVLIVDTD